MIPIPILILLSTLAQVGQSPAPAPKEGRVSARAIVVDGHWRTARGQVYPGSDLHAGDVVTTVSKPAQLEVMTVDGGILPMCRNGQGAECRSMTIPDAAPASLFSRVWNAIGLYLRRDPGRIVPAGVRGATTTYEEHVLRGGAWTITVNLPDARAQLSSVVGPPPDAEACKSRRIQEGTQITCETGVGVYEVVATSPARPESATYFWVGTACDEASARQVSGELETATSSFGRDGHDISRHAVRRAVLVQAAHEQGLCRAEGR